MRNFLVFIVSCQASHQSLIVRVDEDLEGDSVSQRIYSTVCFFIICKKFNSMERCLDLECILGNWEDH